MEFRIKRIYEKPSKADGCRVLVDRLWPRGLAKADAHLDLWAKDLAPSNELRKWFHENTDRYEDFAAKYRNELRGSEAEDTLASIDKSPVTLLTAVKTPEHSHVPVLKEFLEELDADK